MFALYLGEFVAFTYIRAQFYSHTLKKKESYFKINYKTNTCDTYPVEY